MCEARVSSGSVNVLGCNKAFIRTCVGMPYGMSKTLGAPPNKISLRWALYNSRG